MHAGGQTLVVPRVYASSRIFNNMRVAGADGGGGTVAERLPVQSQSVPDDELHAVTEDKGTAIGAPYEAALRQETETVLG